MNDKHSLAQSLPHRVYEVGMQISHSICTEI